MNHAERPLLVMKAVVTAAIITIVTAPDQKLQVHWSWPDRIAQEHKHWRDEQGNLGGASEGDADAHIQPVLARGNATAISAAAPTKATIINPTNAGGIRGRCVLHGFDEDLAYQATRTVTTRSVAAARPTDHLAPSVSP